MIESPVGGRQLHKKLKANTIIRHKKYKKLKKRQGKCSTVMGHKRLDQFSGFLRNLITLRKAKNIV